MCFMSWNFINQLKQLHQTCQTITEDLTLVSLESWKEKDGRTEKSWGEKNS